jgi:hypothetical protein
MTIAYGDQIYVMRELVGGPGIYQHHGIACGDQTVIHYSKAPATATVMRTSFDSFARGNVVYHVEHTVCYVPDIVIQRAQSRLGEQQYDLFANNCEHFANWCKTGRNESFQLANFGLRPDLINLPTFRRLASHTAQDNSPERAMALFQKALGDIATAYHTLLAEQQTAQQEADTWHRVAEKALAQNREDLARAALLKKVNHRQRADALTQQLADLVDMQLTLEQNRQLSEQRLLDA